MYLSKMYLHDFKKFRNNEFDFEKGLNIIIGKNSAGKSTILQAIDIALNQRGNGDLRNHNEYGTLLNVQSKKDFLNSDLSIKSLPIITIELFFQFPENRSIKLGKFNGINNTHSKMEDGIIFQYKFDEDFEEDYDLFIKNFNELGKRPNFIPFEYYKASWHTFAANNYNYRSNPFKSILIDTDKSVGDSYRQFTNQVFNSLPKSKQNFISIELKKSIDSFNENISNEMNNKLEIDPNRTNVKDSLEIFNDMNSGILLRDMGSGKENIIKTNIALNDTESRLILIEEPENHLSFDLSRKQINKIQSKDDQQLIITTHSPLIVSKLNLKNIKWINGNDKFVSFSKLNKKSADFFLKADNIDVLQVIVAEKVILVEGSAEYITMKNMIQQIYNKDSDELGIHIISMGGDLYEKFKPISEIVKNKILVITDNDQSKERINNSYKYNDENFNVSMPTSISDFTFEVALFNANESFFCSEDWNHISTKDSWKNHPSLDKNLVWLLNNKAEAAFEYADKFLEEKDHGEYILDVPKYIREGLEWLTK